MGKHTLEIEYDFDFLLIGISSHEKDYRICWALNNKLGLNLVKQESFEIKDRKQSAPSFFSFFTEVNEELFREYSVIANFSENKKLAIAENNLFSMDESGIADHSENNLLIPEQKQLNYFFILRGEVEEEEIAAIMKQIKAIDVVLTAVRIDPKTLRSKQNLIF